jgi:hypothetical protein
MENTPDNVVTLPEEISLDTLDLTDRIELLNALRSIRDQLPRVKKASPAIERYVHRRFIDWVDGHIKKVLGEPQESAFSQQEIAALKALAAKVQQRQEGPQPVNRPEWQAPKTPVSPTQKASPLKETVDVEKFRKSQEDFLRQLEAMDRNAPQF